MDRPSIKKADRASIRMVKESRGICDVNTSMATASLWEKR